MAKTPRRARKAKEIPSNVADLLDALAFVKLAQSDVGPAHEVHCMLGHGMLTAFNGTLAAGHPVADPIICNPHTYRLADALNHATEAVGFAKNVNGDLSVISGHFRASVPCVETEMLRNAQPDAAIANVSNALIIALDAVRNIAREKAENVFAASVLIRAGSVIATDGKTLIEAWHGLDLPTISVPRSLADAVCGQVKMNLSKFGYSERTATFWFENGAWLRSQLYVEKYPDVDRITEKQPPSLLPIPPDFWRAVKAVQAFAKEGFVTISNCYAMTSDDPAQGAAYLVDGLHPDFRAVLSVKQLAHVLDWPKYMARSEDGSMVFFLDDTRRAVLSTR